MKILAIDSSGNVASAAVMDNGILIGEYSINNKLTHSQKLMPMVDELLKSLELKPEEIDVYACSMGPGSFTGLRIGISAVKGIAQALNKPVIGIPTLDGLAWNVQNFAGYICPMIDARNDNVYTAIYSSSEENSEIKLISEYLAVHINELIERLPNDNRIMFLGDGVFKFRDLLENKFGRISFFPAGHQLLQRAGSICAAANQKAAAKELDSVFNLTPIYLRQAQAERVISTN